MLLGSAVGVFAYYKLITVFNPSRLWSCRMVWHGKKPIKPIQIGKFHNNKNWPKRDDGRSHALWPT